MLWKEKIGGNKEAAHLSTPTYTYKQKVACTELPAQQKMLTDATARTMRKIQFQTYIGRSATADQNGTLAVATPIPWYMTSSVFGAGWWKLVTFYDFNGIYSIRISADPNDAGPWWVIEDNSSGTPVVRVAFARGFIDINSNPSEAQLLSEGWMIFFFLDTSIVNNPSSKTSTLSYLLSKLKV